MLWFLLQSIFLQTIQVNATTPCFMNFTRGHNIWQDCGASTDFLEFALLPFEWATGGNFSMILVSVMILVTYIKYHKIIYPIMIGVMFLPVSFFLFPDSFLSYAFILGIGLGAGVFIYYILTRQTKEY